jgi:alkylation response protein AidB-like acyl-CoA dehydrogenase
MQGGLKKQPDIRKDARAMDFSFTEEQTLLRDSVERFVPDKYDFDTRQKIVASDEGWSRANWQQMAELGLMLGMPFSEEQGGLGGGPIDVMVDHGRVRQGPRGRAVHSHDRCGRRLPAPRHRRRRLKSMCPASSVARPIFAFAYAEPQGRYNLADLVTTAKKDGDGYRDQRPQGRGARRARGPTS